MSILKPKEIFFKGKMMRKAKYMNKGRYLRMSNGVFIKDSRMEAIRLYLRPIDIFTIKET